MGKGSINSKSFCPLLNFFFEGIFFLIFSANGDEFMGNWANDFEEGEGILTIEGKCLKGFWEKGTLVEILDGFEEVDDVLGKCMEKVPSLSVPSEDGVILE